MLIKILQWLASSYSRAILMNVVFYPLYIYLLYIGIQQNSAATLIVVSFWFGFNLAVLLLLLYKWSQLRNSK